MKNEEKISVAQYCTYYSIEASFVDGLNKHSLIELSYSGNETFIAYDQIADLEKYIRLHYDMGINLEGIEAIKHLLDRTILLQKEIKRLRGEHYNNDIHTD
ncbi:MAG: chaperone modulator CbpM [Agriterribacter sp.]